MVRVAMNSYSLSLAEAKSLSEEGIGNVVPICREVSADLETPVSAYLKVARGDNSFLLESVEGGERMARYSFIGTEPYRVLRAGPYAHARDGADPLVEVEQELSHFRPVPAAFGGGRGQLPRFSGGAVGFLAYEVARHFEPRLPMVDADPQGLPEAVFLFVDTLLVFDHLKHVIKVVSNCRLDGNVEDSYRRACLRVDDLAARLSCPVPPLQAPLALDDRAMRSNLAKETFEARVEKVRRHIASGDIIQAVLSRRLSRRTAASPFSIYRALRVVNPSPYMYYLSLGDAQIIGASPEMLVRVEDGLVSTNPIAGTRPRGRDQNEDEALEAELSADSKEIAEHVMLLDLGRNDIGRVSRPGSVQVPQRMEVERYSHVMHIVSQVTGRMREGLSSFDALRACFPAGTVSGAPKIRAMEIIAELEPDRRGPYAGAVGYFDYSGNLDTAITIRTIVMRDGVANIQAGAGIVYDSVPEREFDESLNKAQALLSAIDMAEAMEETDAAPTLEGRA